eukprot:3562697-Amphidinium_carterae.1
MVFFADAHFMLENAADRGQTHTHRRLKEQLQNHRGCSGQEDDNPICIYPCDLHHDCRCSKLTSFSRPLSHVSGRSQRYYLRSAITLEISFLWRVWTCVLPSRCPCREWDFVWGGVDLAIFGVKFKRPLTWARFQECVCCRAYFSSLCTCGLQAGRMRILAKV